MARKARQAHQDHPAHCNLVGTASVEAEVAHWSSMPDSNSSTDRNTSCNGTAAAVVGKPMESEPKLVEKSTATASMTCSHEQRVEV